MSDWTPFIISIVLLALVGFVMPLVAQPFVNEGQYNPDSFVAPIIDRVDTGFQKTVFWFFDVDVNPFAWFGDGFQSYLKTQLSTFSYLPNIIAIPLLIIILFGLIYTPVKMIPFT